jgi:enamine deaminase RidA (YjgF/YER057c/UK114 family)
MAERPRVSSGAKWEPIHGYSRAVRAGSTVYVSGTVGLRPDGSVAPDAYGQTLRALEIIRTALEELGARVEDVVRTRVFVTDVGQFDEVARAHREMFGDIRPASTMVEVRRLLNDAFLVEIEADAVISTEENHV